MIQELFTVVSAIIIAFGLLFSFILISNKRLENNFKKIDSLIEENSFSLSTNNKYLKLILFFKRIFDIFLSSFSIVFLFPIFPTIACLIKMDSRGPLLFQEKKMGRDGDFFYVYKFRTMYCSEDITENNYIKSEKDPRVTKVGLFLRKTGLSELPLIFNIFKGEMSFVGTSIVTEFEYENIPEIYKINLEKAKPGLTSLWSVSGSKQKFSYEKRLDYDLYYVENISLRLDLLIIFKAIVVVLGITAKQ